MQKRRPCGIANYHLMNISRSYEEGANATIHKKKSFAQGFRNMANYNIAILFHCDHHDMKLTLLFMIGYLLCHRGSEEQLMTKIV